MKRIIINKNNLLHNLEVLKARSKTKICAVVKANAYAHGVREICTILKNKVEFFAVANLEEALEIREFDKTSKVLIMGKCTNYETAILNNISVTAFSLTEFFKCKNASEKLEKACNIHVKINSGMNRIGISNLKQFKIMLKNFQDCKYLNFEGLFTHFCTLRNDIDFFQKQQKIFNEFRKLIPKTFNPVVHGGGSLTVLHEQDYGMLRCGILLYGYGDPEFKPVLKIEDSIIQVRKIKKGAFVGYSKDYIAEKNMTIGVFATGYDDGIPRNSIGQYVKIGDEECKILNVCMDMTIIEVPKKTKENDTVTILYDIKDWVKAQKTNDHEILVRFNSFRGQRIIE